jgi:hypothetical protein
MKNKLVLKSKYYLQIYTNNKNIINVFILYNLKDNLIYFGVDKISDQHEQINHNKINLDKAIPISETSFKYFLNLSLSDLSNTNKNIFLAINGLEEWII